MHSRGPGDRRQKMAFNISKSWTCALMHSRGPNDRRQKMATIYPEVGQVLRCTVVVQVTGDKKMAIIYPKVGHVF